MNNIFRYKVVKPVRQQLNHAISVQLRIACSCCHSKETHIHMYDMDQSQFYFASYCLFWCLLARNKHEINNNTNNNIIYKYYYWAIIAMRLLTISSVAREQVFCSQCTRKIVMFFFFSFLNNFSVGQNTGNEIKSTHFYALHFIMEHFCSTISP